MRAPEPGSAVDGPPPTPGGHRRRRSFSPIDPNMGQGEEGDLRDQPHGRTGEEPVAGRLIEGARRARRGDERAAEHACREMGGVGRDAACGDQVRHSSRHRHTTRHRSSPGVGFLPHPVLVDDRTEPEVLDPRWSGGGRGPRRGCRDRRGGCRVPSTGSARPGVTPLPSVSGVGSRHDGKPPRGIRPYAGSMGTTTFPGVSARDLRASTCGSPMPSPANETWSSCRANRTTSASSTRGCRGSRSAAADPEFRCYELPTIGRLWVPMRRFIDGGMAATIRDPVVRQRPTPTPSPAPSRRGWRASARCADRGRHPGTTRGTRSRRDQLPLRREPIACKARRNRNAGDLRGVRT